ncbi:MAG: hypothetical protein LCH41_01110 [Armatimonadetes bacterium]|nr:hypothetical protein [Armatimonadota bacterium]
MTLDWSMDFGDGPRAVEVPHVWHGSMPMSWEGPALYSCEVDVPPGGGWLVFHGVSYLAVVRINDEEVLRHEGIWDAFSLDLRAWAGSKINLSVEVVKNGGPSYPVKDVASGFLPYVYHTFGGIFREVEWSASEPILDAEAPPSRMRVEEDRVFVDGQPFFGRGVLTWGWYPETTSPHPDEDTFIKEIDTIQRMGFNLIKFCLWLPPHGYLEEMNRRGMMAWIELPIWLPSSDAAALERMKQESLRIVRQYRRHSNILAWTAGCELSEGIPPEWRRDLVAEIQALTRHPLVKDNSGGAEMYGGHPAEFGTFEDFHPYCDPMFYPQVMDSLSAGPRERKPIFFGEFNDHDLVRPLHQWVEETPYWASDDPALNAQGVRWQYDFPAIVEQCRSGSLGDWLVSRWEELIATSISQSTWMREEAFDLARMVPGCAGWVVTGHRHTPISSTGMVDDTGEPIFPPEVTKRWTSDTRLILFPRRTPPWIDGGNRVGWEPTRVRFAGECLFQVAVHSVHGEEGSLAWEIGGFRGVCDAKSAPSMQPTEVGRFVVHLTPGVHDLELRWGRVVQRQAIHVVERGGSAIPDFLIPPAESLARPFFRESCLVLDHPIWRQCGWEHAWPLWRLVASDTAMSSAWLDSAFPGWEPILTRLDTRTYERAPLAVRHQGKIITTLRPQGGLGDQPIGVSRNPGGHALIRTLRALLAGP